MNIVSPVKDTSTPKQKVCVTYNESYIIVLNNVNNNCFYISLRKQESIL